MKEFDANNCALDGVNVIEASAGTGKTYNIQLLVLRLLLEKKIPLQKILVVTFTVFATEELRSRLHNIILLTDRAFEEYSKDKEALSRSEFSQIREVVQREFIHRDEARKAECRELIRRALRDFAQTAIMTIHGFCQRMLLDHAFASKVNFCVELKEDITELQHKIAMDFIRLIRYSDTEGLNSAIPDTVTADLLLDKLKLAIDNADNQTEIIWRETCDNSWQEQLEALPALNDPRDIYDSLGSCFLKFYREQLAKYKARDNFFTFNDLIKLMADVVKDEEDGRNLINAVRSSFDFAFVDEFQDTDPLQFEIFSRIFGGSGSDRGFFMIGDPKQAIYSFRGGDIYAYKEAVRNVPEKRKFTLSRNFRSGSRYIEELNTFLSEFPLEDFSEIQFGGSEKRCLCKDNVPMESLLQFDFQETGKLEECAVKKVLELLSGRYTLQIPGKNDSKPVTAEDIAILFPTKAKGAELEKQLNKRGIDTIWMSESDIFQKPEAKALYDLLKMLYDGCSFPQVLNVLSGNIFQCLAPELRRLQEPENADGNEASAEYAQAAREYFMELRKIWEQQGFYAMFRKLLFAPNREGRQWLSAVRENMVGRFEETSSLAQHLVHADFVEGRYVLGRLRQLGNLLHQTEQDRQLTPGRLLKYLMNKIQKNDSEGVDTSGTQLIQRCTDAPAVRMLTLHKSKGLQFPIVLMPYCITHDSRITPRLYHDISDSGPQRCLDMQEWNGTKAQRDKSILQICEEEKLSEKKRLFYVGITRAKYYCYLSASNNKGVYKHLRALILQTLDKIPDANTRFIAVPCEDGEIPENITPENGGYDTASARSFKGEIVRDWNLASFSGFVRSYHGTGKEKNKNDAVTNENTYGGTDELLNDLEIQVSGKKNLPPPPPLELTGDDAQSSIFDFGSGAEMGTVWHEIFEKMDFAADIGQEDFFEESRSKEILAAVKEPVLYYGLRRYREEDEESRRRDTAFARMLKGILYNPIGEMSKPSGEHFQLSRIPPSRRASELKFMFVLKENVTLQQIKACLEKYDIPTGTWASSAEAEYKDHALIGFIDLLLRSDSGKYYIVDWKSNRLDQVMSSFDQAGMQAEVDRNLYSLQFLIYTVALWHFLKERQRVELTRENYEKYFGGILYLFVRGIAAPLPEMSQTEKEICRKRGIYYTCPPYELIAELRQLLELRQLQSGSSRKQQNPTE